MNRESLHRESVGTQPTQSSTFEDLDVYQVAREFRKAMYRVAKKLPEIEKFALASQIRRAAVSLTNNIAEGHGRYHYPDQIRFELQSRGSLQELIDDLNTCEDEQYLALQQIVDLRQGWRVRQVIDGYIRYLRQQASSARIKEEEPSYGDDSADSRCHDSRLNHLTF